MNSDTTPSKTASGAANGTTEEAERDVHAGSVDGGEQQARVEVAAGLVDRLVPDEEHALLALGRKDAADGSSHLRPFGHEVEREEPGRRPTEQAAQDGRRDAEDASGEVRRVADDVLGTTLDLLGQLRLIDRDPQPVQPSRDRGHPRVGIRHQLPEARDDGRHDQHEQDGHGDQDEHEHETGGDPTPHPPAGEPVHGRLDGEGQEQGRQDDGEEIRQPTRQVQDHERPDGRDDQDPHRSDR
jgi:hypothetical protein